MAHHEFFFMQNLRLHKKRSSGRPGEPPLSKTSGGKPRFQLFQPFSLSLAKSYSAAETHLLLIAACAAASLAIGTRKGEQDT